MSIETGKDVKVMDGSAQRVNKVCSIFFSLSLLLFSIRKGEALTLQPVAVADGSVQFLVLLLLTLGTRRSESERKALKRGRREENSSTSSVCVCVCYLGIRRRQRRKTGWIQSSDKKASLFSVLCSVLCAS